MEEYIKREGGFLTETLNQAMSIFSKARDGRADLSVTVLKDWRKIQELRS
jgi:hypothetical protein